nr:unnamed protein product [Callosobruchus analis]
MTDTDTKHAQNEEKEVPAEEFQLFRTKPLKDEKDAPPDRFCLVFMIFFFFGMGIALPGPLFSRAQDPKRNKLVVCGSSVLATLRVIYPTPSV